MGSLGISTGFAHSVALQNADLLECHGLIGGAWVAAHNDKTFPVHDPSTGKVLGLVGDFGEDDFIRAIRSAEVAYRQFSRNTTAKERAVLLQRWEQLILENADDRKKPRLVLSLPFLLRLTYLTHSGNDNLSRKRQDSC